MRSGFPSRGSRHIRVLRNRRRYVTQRLPPSVLAHRYLQGLLVTTPVVIKRIERIPQPLSNEIAQNAFDIAAVFTDEFGLPRRRLKYLFEASRGMALRRKPEDFRDVATLLSEKLNLSQANIASVARQRGSANMVWLARVSPERILGAADFIKTEFGLTHQYFARAVAKDAEWLGQRKSKLETTVLTLRGWFPPKKFIPVVACPEILSLDGSHLNRHFDKLNDLPWRGWEYEDRKWRADQLVLEAIGQPSDVFDAHLDHLLAKFGNEATAAVLGRTAQILMTKPERVDQLCEVFEEYNIDPVEAFSKHSILSKRNPHKLRETLEWIRSHFGLEIVRSCSTLWQRSVQLKLEPTLQGLLAADISMDYIKEQPWLLTQNPGDEVDPARAMNMQTTFD